jgi:hypothetical protein
MSRACPNGHPIPADPASRFCPTCGALLVPAEAAAAHVARAAGEASTRDPGRISPRAMAIGLALVAVTVGVVAGILALNAPRPAASPAPSGAAIVRVA